MVQNPHLVVVAGPDKDRQIVVPPEGARVGRSSKNDIALNDPMMSRHHCRLFFKTDAGMWVADLGSSNQTFVNGQPVQEQRLSVGDMIGVGETTIRVLSDIIPGIASVSPAISVSAPTVQPGSVHESPAMTAQITSPEVPPPQSGQVDLGLSAGSDGTSVDQSTGPKQKFGVKRLLTVAGVAALITLLIYLVPAFPAVYAGIAKLFSGTGKDDIPPVAAKSLSTLEIDYEKVEATAENIFRYRLALNKVGIMSVQIDDLKNDRHVRREKAVDPEYVQNLARQFLDSGFFQLEEEYRGIQPEILQSFDMSVTAGSKTRRCRVINRVEPDVFKTTRERLEEAGKNELGLAAIQFSAEKLAEMAQQAYVLGTKLFEEREIKYGNLAAAIRSLNEATWYLETVDPKPAFYAKAIAAATDCKKELEQKYNDAIFKVERSVNMRQWEDAARDLRMILELIPDRADNRNVDARRRLLDVESRLEKR